MRTIFVFVFLALSSAAWGQDIFDRFGEVLSGISVQDSMHPWEKDLSTQEWQKILENCYDRAVNPDAKDALNIYLKRHDKISMNASERKKNQEMLLYCSHSLSLSNKIGINISVIPLYPEDKKSVFRAQTVEDCYFVSEKGFSERLRHKLRMAIQARREISGKEKAYQVTAAELITVYPAFCGVFFSKDKDIPVQVIFSNK